jgi:uncharacterized phiE125 gp8 family phage protein
MSRSIHWGLTVVTATTVEPVPTADVKDWLRINSTETAEDSLITSITKAARKRIEEYTGRVMLKQTYDWTLDKLPDKSTEPLIVPVAPLSSVTSITTYDEDNTATVWSTSEYTVDTASEPGRIMPKDAYDWPGDLRNHNAVVIRLVAGYTTDRASVPEGLATGVKAYAAYLYEHRGDEIPTFAGQLTNSPHSIPPLSKMVIEDFMLPEWG